MFFNLKIPPNLLRGSDILLKSLVDKLLSPIRFIGFEVLIKNPSINLPSVPEFSALSVRSVSYTHLTLPTIMPV